MSDKKNPTQGSGKLQQNLKHLVGFGSEPSSATPTPPANVTERLKELVRRVEDLNRRVDRLKDQF